MAQIEFSMVTTRGGDRGESSLYDGSRVRKDDIIFEALGAIDELNSYLGLLRAELAYVGNAADAPIAGGSNTGSRSAGPVDARPFDPEAIHAIQADTLKLGAMIATPPKSDLYSQIGVVTQADVERLESQEHSLMQRVPISDRFVLPGSNRASAEADVCRTVCRRAERAVVACIRQRHLGHLNECQHYLNRLSDYLFVIARALESEPS